MPPPYDAGYSYVRHPFALETMPLHTRGIPLGVVDPVSGFAAFVPVWNEGFEFGLGNMVMNAAFVRAKAKEALDDAVKGIEPACGIGALGLVPAVALGSLCESCLHENRRGRADPCSAGSNR